MSIPKVYGMNNCTTFDESDFESVKELYKLYNQEIESDRFNRDLPELSKTDLSWHLPLREKRHYVFKEVPTKNSLKEDIKKDSFYKNQGWKSIVVPPRVYKLSGSVTTFDPYEIEMNNKLPQRVLNGVEQIRKIYEEALTEKDIKENPFINCCIIQRLRCPNCSKVNEVPKEKSVFSCCKCEASLSAPKIGRPMTTPITTSPISIPKPPPKWEAHKDAEGDTYYYNVITKVTQWEKPLEL